MHINTSVIVELCSYVQLQSLRTTKPKSCHSLGLRVQYNTIQTTRRPAVGYLAACDWNYATRGVGLKQLEEGYHRNP